MFDHSWNAAAIRPIVETCLDQFGPNRCMFGSNLPVDSLSSDYKTLAAAYEALLPDAAKPAVFGSVATEFYGLDR
jgi:predicted TIM-barrel fold metal-dependent hydrolase